MFCPSCGAQIKDGAKFCSGCGAQMAGGGGEKAATKTYSPPCELCYRIKGEVLQLVEIDIPRGERVFSETGGMLWMDQTIEMETSIQKGKENKGLLDTLIKAGSRVLQGESLFLNYFVAASGDGSVAFASSFPGKILPFKLAQGESIIAQRGSFLVGQEHVDLNIEWRGIGSALFGGEGLVLQRLTGPGLVFLEIDGELTERDLKPGEQLLIDTGHIACFQSSVNYDIQLQKGFKNILLGGEGIFLARLTGPGKVWIQHMTMCNLAGRLVPFLPFERSGKSKGINLNLG
ncbi:MAG: TIGR00266 family protein [bacterium]